MAEKDFYIDHRFTIWERTCFVADEEDLPAIIEDVKKGDYTKCENNVCESKYVYNKTDEINRKTIASEPTLRLYGMNGILIAEEE